MENKWVEIMSVNDNRLIGMVGNKYLVVGRTDRNDYKLLVSNKVMEFPLYLCYELSEIVEKFTQ